MQNAWWGKKKNTSDERPAALPVKKEFARSRMQLINAVLAALLFFGFAFSVFQLVRAVTPSPGHPWTDIGDGIWQATGTTALRTFSFPDLDAEVLTSSSSFTLAQRTVTATTTLNTSTDVVILADGTSQPFSIILPTAVGNNGQVYIIKKIDSALANQISITPTSSQTVDGLTSISLSQRGESTELESNGSNWTILTRRDYDLSSYRSKGSTLNQWYSSPNNGTALTTGALTNNTLRAVPFIVSKVTTIDDMAVNITATTSTTGRIRFGIYADNGNAYPGSLVVEAGNTSTAQVTVVTSTGGLPVTLDPGLYWLAGVASSSPTIRGFAVASLNPVLGYASNTPTNAQFGWSVAFTFAALPSTFPNGAAPITAVPIPAFFVRTSQ